jgi:HD-GYP domain-containing protein (c-di-GMP phosphodiesterase class II)
VRILREGRGEQWEPAIVDAFLRCLEEKPAEVQDNISTAVAGSHAHLPAVAK